MELRQEREATESDHFGEIDEAFHLRPDRALAWHEAGHATATWALGARSGGADIIPDGRFGGRALYSIEGCHGVTVTSLIITAAGPIASSRWDRSCPDGGEQDRIEIERGLRAMCRSSEAADIVRRHVQAKAARIVAQNWDMVEAIADALRARHALDDIQMAEVWADVIERRRAQRWRDLVARTHPVSTIDPRITR